MSLDVTKQIKIEEIATIELVKGGKIIILHGNSNDKNDKIVLKVEEGASVAQVKSAKAVMKAVDPSLKTKIVSIEETNALIDAIGGYVEDNALNYILGGEREPHLNAENLEVMLNMLESWKERIAEGNNPLLKMSYVEVKDVRSMLEKRLNNDAKNKTDLRAFTNALNAPGGLEKLGMIIAADMMNDNHDRFSVRGGKGENFPTKNDQLPTEYKRIVFQAMTNPGNVFLQIVGEGGNTLSGLDFIPPVADGADINKDPSTHKDPKYKEKHPIATLTDKTKRNAFAEKVASDLDKMVSPKRGFLGRRRLDSKAAQRLAKGMVDGGRAIREALDKKAKKQNEVSEGLKWRLAELAKLN